MSYAPLQASSLNRAADSQDNSRLSSHISSSQAARSTNGSTSANGATRRVNGHARLRRDGNDHPIIVHSHLCWNWVWQRPQQFLSRLSRRRQILFVEMHRPDSELVAPTARIQTLEAFPNVRLLQ